MLSSGTQWIEVPAHLAASRSAPSTPGRGMARGERSQNGRSRPTSSERAHRNRRAARSRTRRASASAPRWSAEPVYTRSSAPVATSHTSQSVGNRPSRPASAASTPKPEALSFALRSGRRAVGVGHDDVQARTRAVEPADHVARAPPAGNPEALHDDIEVGLPEPAGQVAMHASLGPARRRPRAPRGDANGVIVGGGRGDEREREAG